MTIPKLIDGRAHAQKIKDTLILAINNFNTQYSIRPHLAIIQIGDNPASQIYVHTKLKECRLLKVDASLFHLNQNVDQPKVESLLRDLNGNTAIHGIIIQLPLPYQIDYYSLINQININKDVDGLHPINQGALIAGHYTGMIPCTPLGCLSLLTAEVERLKGKNIAIIGCSKLVGLPLGIILIKHGCTVTFINSRTVNPADIACQADIIIAAAGVPNLVTAKWVKVGATIIDVGITRMQNDQQESKLAGDVDFDDVKNIVEKITPVPGGVGPMTIAFLLTNTVLAAYHSINQTMLDNPIDQIFLDLNRH